MLKVHIKRFLSLLLLPALLLPLKTEAQLVSSKIVISPNYNDTVLNNTQYPIFPEPPPKVISMAVPGKTVVAKVQVQKTNVLKVAPKSYNACSCVSFAKYNSGINVGPIGYAKNHPINSQTPTVGAIVIMKSGNTGHVAVVQAVSATHITVIHSNWKKCKVTTDTFKLTDGKIRGYYVR